MPGRTKYPPGVPCWVDIIEPDADAAIMFYRALFGWQVEAAPGADGYWLARLDNDLVAGIGSGGDNPPAWNTYVSVDSVDATVEKVTAAGGSIVVPRQDVGQAGRSATLADPEGARLSLWEPRGRLGAQLVNTPNSWNFSDLNSRDLTRARTFYGAVFGWQARPVDFGAGEAAMWCVPGYGDFLEQQDPGVRQRHKDAGAPEGFTDAIGWLQQMTSDQYPADVPAHWAVTFAVADTDASAERARANGGTLLVEPLDVPFARIALVRDPQGAVFSISTYMPPDAAA